MSDLYIGLISGTSMDGIDAVLVDFANDSPKLLNAQLYSWPDELKRKLMLAADRQPLPVEALAQLDAEAGVIFAQAALNVLAHYAEPEDVRAIGSHGQTLAHQPEASIGYSLQVGNPNRIAENTGISTIADLRGRDIAAGGQGAPLVSAFHQAVFQNQQENRTVLNIGGIANLTWLPADVSEKVSGFDTGPGNCLMDGWTRACLQQPFDKAGQFASQGKLQPTLLAQLLADPYFAQRPSKSTGTDYFSASWLQAQLAIGYKPEDVQATLLWLTVKSIAQAIEQYYPAVDRVLACGGGCHNPGLMQALSEIVPCPVENTNNYGVAPDWVEAMAFAWLAKQYLQGKPGNIASVTGALGNRVLGALYPA